MKNLKYKTIINAVFIAVAFCITFFLLLDVAYAALVEPTSSIDLIEHSEKYDEQNITFEGEVVGDIMIRGDFTWINISDIDSAIGIWAPRELSDKITYKGGYKYNGDRVRIEGVFHRACSEHGGDLDIHAESIEILEVGSERIHEVSEKKQKLANILLGVLLCLGILNIFKSKLQNK